MSEKNYDLSRINILSKNSDNPLITQLPLPSFKDPMDDEINVTSCGKKGQKKLQEYKQRLYRIDSSEKIPHEKMSWEPEGIDFVTLEAASSSEDACSSASSISSSNFSSTSSEIGWKGFAFEEEKRRQIIESKWGGYALHLRLWDDDNAPFSKVREREDIVLDNLESRGVLSDRIVGACSSFLTQSPENGRYVLSKCDLNRMKLTDISILSYHRYLQYLDLSYNSLSDLQPLEKIPYLMYLNASHNKLKNVLQFTPPWYLTYVNLSYNDITLISDLSEFWSIVTLDLSHNAIETISGLQNLKYLRYLNLSYNLIEIVSNLDNLFSLQELNLEYNYITSFKSVDPESGINTLRNLRTVIMGHNRLSTLEFFRGAYGLRLIDLKYNKIADLLEVSNLKSLVYEVDLRGNPCTKWPSYKEVLLFSMPSVKFVDGGEVTVSEKVSATTVFDPPVELLAARSISKLVLLDQLNEPKFDDSVPFDESSPPLVILSGPSAVKKVDLGLRLAEKLSKRVRYCRSHTTRDVSENEDESRAYYFVKRDEFNDMARRGEFLSIQELLGNSYGFHTSEIGALRRENKIGITQMDLNATIQMASRYSNVKLVLVLTKDEEIHRRWITDQFHVFTWIKDSVENLLALKIGTSASAECPENSMSKIQFISDLVNEVVNNLELPVYSMCIRPQGTGATATDIIRESKIFLPKPRITRSQLEVEGKRHISFRTEDSKTLEAVEEIVDELGPKPDELRVILDEHSNIIVDDEESKRKRKRARILFRRSILEIRGNGIFDDDEFADSISSEQSFHKFPERRTVEPEYLKNMYINIVLKSRMIYVDYHLTKPGFYSLVIFTDDFKKAFSSLHDFIYELHHYQSFRKPILQPEIEYLQRSVIPEKVQAIVKELRESLSTSKMQKKTLLRTYGMSSWSELMPSQTVQSANKVISTMEKLRKRSYANSVSVKK